MSEMTFLPSYLIDTLTDTGIPCFYYALLYHASQILHFLQIEGCGKHHFFCTAFAHFHISVPHFGNFCSISNVFIILFIMVICDQ